ncbi:MAG: cytochrome C, partial [Acidobacteriota bacterium]|nr:cytochrome C [Acidobacteriota bacterium]
MPELEQMAVESKEQAGAKRRYFLRFTSGQRYLHAVLFTTFLGLAATGLPLRFSDSVWARAIARAVGGFGAILFLHKLCAVVLTLAFLIHVKDVFTRKLVNREKGIFWGPTSMVANWKDAKDLIGHFRWFLGLGPRPRFERYAYWEKFDYWAVFWGMVVIGFSGYAMWFAPFFAHFLPGWALNAVLVIHSEEALLAILFIFSIHFVNTHLRPDSFPMDMVIFTGVETEEEFKAKRPMEFERVAREGTLEKRLAEA